MENQYENLSWDLPKNQSNVIKVIGVGGGGSNAINYMYNKGINGVDYVICNTDAQALENSPVPNKVQLGINLTEGMGAGADPKIGEKAFYLVQAFFHRFCGYKNNRISENLSLGEKSNKFLQKILTF